MAEPVKYMKDVKKNNSISWEEVILLILGIIALLFFFIPYTLRPIKSLPGQILFPCDPFVSAVSK